MRAETEPMQWLDAEGVGAAVAAAPVARLAVGTRRGPLVSSLLQATSGGRTWMISSRRSAHVRVIRRRPQVGLVLRSGRRAVVIAGDAEVLALWGPREALHLGLEAGAALAALLGYGLHNSTRMAGYVADMVRIPLRPEALPFDRVLIAVTPRRGFVSTGAAVAHIAGTWPGDPDGAPARPARRTRSSGRHPGLPEGIPAWVASLVDGRQACTVGWATPAGPLALPATWDPAGWRAELAPPVAALAAPALASAPACIALDRSVALRPSSYTGLVLRGQGRLEPSPQGEGPVGLVLAMERVSWWSGFDKGTVAVTRTRGRRSAEEARI